MTFRIRLLIGAILVIPVGYLAVLAEEKYHKDVYHFFLTILWGIGGYLLLYYVFQKSNARLYWTVKTDRIIAFITTTGILVFGINMSNRIDENLPSFWVANGNNWLTDLLGALIALLFFYVIISWIIKQWKNIQTLKNEKSIAELALLKNQINPHFFFNTLNNLYSLIKKDPDTAQAYVLKLSDMMRFTIYKGKEELVTLQDEINYLNNFIELQTARYHKRIEIDFQKDIRNIGYTISPLLFIILLENAFKHGVESLVNNAFIYIQLEESNDKIIFKIKNNYDSEELSKVKGIGLINLKERLNLLYPKSHSLTSMDQNDIYFVKLELNKK